MRYTILTDGNKYLLPPREERLKWQQELWDRAIRIWGEEMRSKRRYEKMRRFYTDPLAVEDTPECLIGYKILLHRPGFPYPLYSNWNKQTWDHRNGITATCTASNPGLSFQCHDSHWVPFPNCSCGIYTYKYIKSLSSESLSTIAVRTKIGGYVIEHAKGYRSQYAVIDAILNTEKDSTLSRDGLVLSCDMLGLIADWYNVPLLDINDA